MLQNLNPSHLMECTHIKKDVEKRRRAFEEAKRPRIQGDATCTRYFKYSQNSSQHLEKALADLSMETDSSSTRSLVSTT